MKRNLKMLIGMGLLLSLNLWVKAETVPIQVDFQCSQINYKATDVIHSIWISGHEYSQYDGGYVPFSILHNQGYELYVAGNDLVLGGRSMGDDPMTLGTLGPKASCDGNFSENTVQADKMLETTIETGQETPCQSRKIDSRPQYFKSAELTVTLKNTLNGRQAVLRSTVHTTLVDSQEECEKMPLGNEKQVFPAAQ